MHRPAANEFMHVHMAHPHDSSSSASSLSSPHIAFGVEPSTSAITASMRSSRWLLMGRRHVGHVLLYLSEAQMQSSQNR